MNTFLTSEWPQTEKIADIREDEARQKLCCGPVGCGLVGENGARLCAGSDCMAWRRGLDLIECGPHMKLCEPGGKTVARFDQQVFRGTQENPYPPIEDFRPEGEGWYLAHTYGDVYLAHWERHAAQRGHCGFIGGGIDTASSHGAGSRNLERRR